MNRETITRREANRRLAMAAAGAMAAPTLLATRRAAAQPTSQPSGKPSILDNLITKGRQRDWTLGVSINVNMLDNTDSSGMPVNDPLNFSSAVIVFPVLLGTASSKTFTEAVTSKLTFNDVPINTQVQYNDQYPGGARFGRWAMGAKTGRELQLDVDIPMHCWETQFDEKTAMQVDWPKNWPKVPASTFEQQPYLDYQTEPIHALVRKWTNDKDPRSVKPVELAKWFAGQVQQMVQINGVGTTTADNGLIEGVDVRSASIVARDPRGTAHDATILLAATYLAAGLPARTVIGYDVSEEKGEDKSFLGRRGGNAELRSWVEFCLYDEAADKQLWVPVDVVRLRERSSRIGNMKRPWKYFGTNDRLDDTMPFAFQFHPPVAGVVAHGSPAFFGWFTTPKVQHAEQFLRFTSNMTPKRSNTPKPGE